MSKTEIKNLISLDRIFDFFKRADYNVEADQIPYPVSELVEKEIEGEVWTVIDDSNLTVLVITSKNYNQKSYRTKINNHLKELVGTKIIFYTENFTHYNLTIIFDGIFNITFNPSNPEMQVVRILEEIETQKDLFDYTKQDINFILLKRELTANELKESIREGDNSAVKLIFQEGGLKLKGEGEKKIILSHDDAPVRDMAIDVKLDYEHDVIKNDDLQFISNLYKDYQGRNLKLACIITKNGLLYHWLPYSIFGFIGFKNQLDEDIIDDVLESLIAQVSVRTAFNSETFHQQFGTHSPFFILGITAFQQFFDEEQKRIKIMYEEWKSRFSKVYQSGDLDRELFIKHAYLSLIVKTVLVSKFVGSNQNTSEDKIEKLIEIFEDRGVPLFLHDFFQWTSEEVFVQGEIFEALHKASFVIDDLFRTIYQEMVSPATRHALGEFYTPAPLAQNMVEDAYKFGQFVLDPACGSGTFLIEILNIIENSHKEKDEKIEAISKIYGFDINPIAVLVARSNLLLLTDKIFSNHEKIPINIFLADSLNPINEFITDIDKSKLYKKNFKKERLKEVKDITSLEKWGASKFGKTERFNMPAINDSLVINIKFFKYSEKFGDLLKELDKYLSKSIDFDMMLKNIYNSIDDNWLDELCEGSSNETLRNNFKSIAEKLFNFVKNDKNHIWAYLLYNAIGVRKMKETMDGVDLIIGNPPWLTIHDILSYDYKNNIKNLAENLGIYMGGKQAPHAELCSIFFYRSADLYLKKNGKIFFVATTALETGSQHSKFRMLEGFKDVFIWKFEKDVFKIRNICIGATFGDQPITDRLNIKTKLFDVSYQNKKWGFDMIKEELYVPNNIKQINRDLIAKRLIPKSKIEEMLPLKESYYKDNFYQGASLVPRNLIFIEIKTHGDNTSIIKPSSNISSKKPWKFTPFKQEEIENEYIFNCAKSTELVPFCHLYTHFVFLPIEKNDYEYHADQIKPNSKRLFDKLKSKYREIQEKDQRVIKSLYKRINYNNGLSKPNQRSKIKVVFPGSGKYMKSAVICDEKTIIDTKLYYLSLNSIKEAYYICAILNSRIITEDLKYRSSTGFQGKGAHIHKRVLDYPIPKFNKNHSFHQKISTLGKTMESQVQLIIKNLKKIDLNGLKNKYICKFCQKSYVKSLFEKFQKPHEDKCENVENNYKWTTLDWIDGSYLTLDDIKLSQQKIQNVIFNDPDMKVKFEELDELVIKLLKSER